ncbi:unnamed protein product, partial [Oppiella nova]
MDITFTKDVPVENLQLITLDHVHMIIVNMGKDLYGIFAPIQCPITANKYTLDLKDMQLPDVGDVYKKVIEKNFFFY